MTFLNRRIVPRLLMLTALIASSAAAAPCDYYASPGGSGTVCTAVAPCRVDALWAHARSAVTLCLKDGVYTGTGSNLDPPDNLSGIAGAPITVRAENDGQVRPNNRYLNNIIYGNAYATSLSTKAIVSGTIARDPGLVSYRRDGTDDYHLAAGSPAIDAGTGIGASATDLEGNSRPLGGAFDIGPYEYRTPTTGPPAPPTTLSVR